MSIQNIKRPRKCMTKTNKKLYGCTNTGMRRGNGNAHIIFAEPETNFEFIMRLPQHTFCVLFGLFV